MRVSLPNSRLSRLYGRRYLSTETSGKMLQQGRKSLAMENGLGNRRATIFQATQAESIISRITLKRILPHILLLVAASLYIVGGGYAFYMMERHFRHPHLLKPYSFLSGTSSQKFSVQKRAIKEENCSETLQRALIEAARRECVVLAISDNSSIESHLRYCQTLLLRLSSCVGSTTVGDEPQGLDFATSTTATMPDESRMDNFDQKIRTGEWTLSTCTFMAFTIISTIGYGDVTPVTLWGRLFCILYGMIGIPLALLAVADQGRFLTELMLHFYKKWKRSCMQRFRFKKREEKPPSILDAINEKEEDDTLPTLLLMGLFLLYLVLGACIFTRYEPHWTFVDALYFTFISSSTIGFGDMLPANQTWLPLTLLYVALGLALATAAIDICAEYLRRLHHFGTKIRNCANKLVWFGGKNLTIAELVRLVGNQLGVEEERVENLVENFDAVVEQTIQEKEDKENLPKEPTPPPDPAFDSELITYSNDTDNIRLPYIDSPCRSETNEPFFPAISIFRKVQI